MPTIHSFPVGVPIPISIRVVTITKLMAKSDTPPDTFASAHDQLLFPAPPTGSGDIKLFLQQNVALQAQGIDSSIEDTLFVHAERV